MPPHFDFLIAGAGIFGLSTALELNKKGFKVAVLNPGQIPDPLAAGTDISKAVRMEYGSDLEYQQMAFESMKVWKEWNELFGQKIYHETGLIVAKSSSMDVAPASYERSSYEALLKSGFSPQRLDSADFAKRFPAFNSKYFLDGFYHDLGGYAESGLAVELLAHHLKANGVLVYENSTVQEISKDGGKASGVKTKEGKNFSAGHVIICAGNHTPYLIPELKPYMKVTGHPVFHLQASHPELFVASQFGFFTADIADTGWYGFPLHPKKGIVKIANHGEGVELHPDKDERIVTKKDEHELRQFLSKAIPSLADDPIVYTRRCCYTDTLDGHFWIDNHPEVDNLSVGSGGSGHGFKMGPVVGEMLAAVAMGEEHKWSTRYRWRKLDVDTSQEEEARHIKKA